jgi:hypothetical protein
MCQNNKQCLDFTLKTLFFQQFLFFQTIVPLVRRSGKYTKTTIPRVKPGRFEIIFEYIFTLLLPLHYKPMHVKIA